MDSAVPTIGFYILIVGGSDFVTFASKNTNIWRE